jgi:hypothetical protein
MARLGTALKAADSSSDCALDYIQMTSLDS